MHSAIRIGLIGDFNEQNKAHQSIPRTVQTASDEVECVWIPTDSVSAQSLAGFDGFWCTPGMPYRDAEGAMRAIRHARITRTPFLGTSAGFQYVILEYARYVLGLSEAEHQKANPKSKMPLISPLDHGLAGVRARVHLLPGTHLRKSYGVEHSTEEYHCSFGLNDRYRRLLEGNDLCIAAIDDQDNVRAVELDGHPFFVATLFQPELRQDASPIIDMFVRTAVRRRQGVNKAAS